MTMWNAEDGPNISHSCYKHGDVKRWGWSLQDLSKLPKTLTSMNALTSSVSQNKVERLEHRNVYENLESPWQRAPQIRTSLFFHSSIEAEHENTVSLRGDLEYDAFIGNSLVLQIRSLIILFAPLALLLFDREESEENYCRFHRCRYSSENTFPMNERSPTRLVFAPAAGSRRRSKFTRREAAVTAGDDALSQTD